MIRVDELFDVNYGHSLELNRLTKNKNGVNFVSRTAKNNGVSAKIDRLSNIDPIEAGAITVAYGGSVLETFLQPEVFYTGFHIGVLRPKKPMNDNEKMFYCACIRLNKYRYNYGRQANRTLREILIPDPSEIPAWVNNIDLDMYKGDDAPDLKSPMLNLNVKNWLPFKLELLFEIKKGKRLTKANMIAGTIPYIGAADSKNGVTSFVGQKPIHSGNTISVSYNGSVAEAFYQPVPFWATDDVNVLYPKFDLTPSIGLFLATVIRQEKYRFNYGRKWHLERMKESKISLPVTPDGKPDWVYMEKYIKSLPFSSNIA